MNFFSTILSTIKYRFTAISSALSRWTNKTFIQNTVSSRFQTWFTSLFQFKPRHKKDYYGFFGLLISKRLAHLIVICVGLLCLGYLWVARPFEGLKSSSSTEDYKVYWYNSIPLRFQNGKVGIKHKDGYVAYIGDVKGGYAEGEGELYNEDGGLVYVGDFSESMYNGTGKTYYASGQVEYEGDFVDNLYQGTGKYYRSSGALYYSGDFDEDYFHGTGELYDKTGTQVFTGTFKRGELDYTQFLGLTASEISNLYIGRQILYTNGEENIVALEDLSALYVSENAQTSIDDNQKAASVYVLRSVFVDGDSRLTTIDELRRAFGEPSYEGNSYLTFYDAAAISWALDDNREIDIDPALVYTQEYDELVSVESYDTDALLYMYVFEIDGLSYTFISEGRTGDFFMYVISA